MACEVAQEIPFLRFGLLVHAMSFVQIVAPVLFYGPMSTWVSGLASTIVAFG